jgi:hypothetical protein
MHCGKSHSRDFFPLIPVTQLAKRIPFDYDIRRNALLSPNFFRAAAAFAHLSNSPREIMARKILNRKELRK